MANVSKYDPDQPRDGHGEWTSGGGGGGGGVPAPSLRERATASMADPAFRAEHADRLARADAEARSNFRGREKTPDADRAAANWTRSEAERIHAEHDLHGGDAALKAAGESAAAESRAKGGWSNDQHQAAMSAIRGAKDSAVEDAIVAAHPHLAGVRSGLHEIGSSHDDIVEHLQSLAAGHAKEAPHEAFDRLVETHEKNVSDLSAHVDALHAREAEVHSALEAYNAHQHDNVESDDGIVHESNEDHFEHTHLELGGTALALSDSLGRDSPEGHDSTHEAPPHAAHPDSAPTHPGDAPDPEEHYSEGLEERPQRSEYETDEDYHRDLALHEQQHAEYTQAVTEHQAALSRYNHDKAVYDAAHAAHATSMQSHADRAQSALERLHAQQLETSTRLKDAEKSHEKAAAASSKEASKVSADDLVNHEAFAGHERDFGEDDQGRAIAHGDVHDPQYIVDDDAREQYQAAHDTADREIERVSARQDDDNVAMPDYETPHGALKDEIRDTAAAIRALSKVSGRAPAIGRKSGKTAKSTSYWEVAGVDLLNAIAASLE